MSDGIIARVQGFELQLKESLAARAQIDDKISELRSLIQGINLGVDLQKALSAEQAVEEVPRDYH